MQREVEPLAALACARTLSPEMHLDQPSFERLPPSSGRANHSGTHRNDLLYNHGFEEAKLIALNRLSKSCRIADAAPQMPFSRPANDILELHNRCDKLQ